MGVVIAAMVLSGCAGIGESYTKQNIRRDGLQLLPPGAHNLSYAVLVGDGFNPTMSFTVYFRARSGTPEQRYAQYLAIARRHGWKIKTRYFREPGSATRRSTTATPSSRSTSTEDSCRASIRSTSSWRHGSGADDGRAVVGRGDSDVPWSGLVGVTYVH
jgi:hypothetical protein